MRARMFIWIPVLLSVTTLSWALLLSGLVLLAAVILTPALADVKAAERNRNDNQATLALLDQQIALEKQFSRDATTDPVLMKRLAARQLNLSDKNQDVLILDPATQNQDRSVQSLLAESLQPVAVKEPEPIHPVLAMTMTPSLRPLLIMAACGAICLSFCLGVKYKRA